ncbi:MAG: tRNA uridine 5-carboxymethylaminomethyl modification enzyme MnmG [candidate division TM6 bacterium GW2011_GWE2_41_16]|nr:MAG: tRNA uridine 5-carboxymethylaminomethyl modification enzyme MnmG [candidate division TM6 bacterium GW2011_GWE2_41_16]
MNNTFDVIVIGAGHAGAESAYAAARMGARTLLVTLDTERMGWMPCNPAIGGIGKGHIVFEVAAFGGLMPQLCTRTYLQARMLNTSRGPAVHGLRLQIDKHAYSSLCKEILQQEPNLTIVQDQVVEILLDEKNQCTGVKTESGKTYLAPSTIVTTGVFLNSCIFIGSEKKSSGYLGSPAADKLGQSIKNLGLSMGRLKTGTPPRLLHSSIDFSVMEVQECDPLNFLFEYQPCVVTNSHNCYITHTNEITHQTIRNNFEYSPVFNGTIKGIAPRYCPSIELKVSQFSDKTSHHVFVEPESIENFEVYPNGLSTSLPLDIQEKFIRTIKGFENAIITKPGYAIEYDFVDPTELDKSLEVKKIPGLFLAGQINGTTGYEEAAGQGLIAGINAANKALNRQALILDRYESYIGIMIDDLTRQGIDEPYRMFTSRAEHRLIMRQDNTFARLADHAYTQKLISQEFYENSKHEQAIIESCAQLLIQKKQQELFISCMSSFDYAKAREIATTVCLDASTISPRGLISLYAETLYAPYKKRELDEIEKYKNYHKLLIPKNFEYAHLPGLSNELQQKLEKHQPESIAQASLIQGMTPAALSLLIFKVRQIRGLI